MYSITSRLAFVYLYTIQSLFLQLSNTGVNKGLPVACKTCLSSLYAGQRCRLSRPLKRVDTLRETHPSQRVNKVDIARVVLRVRRRCVDGVIRSRNAFDGRSGTDSSIVVD